MTIFTALAFLGDNAAGPFKLAYVKGDELPIARPTPDDVTVGVDGSTADEYLDRDLWLGGGLSGAEREAKVGHPDQRGERQTGLIVVRVDVALHGACLNGIRYDRPGLYFTTVRNEARLREAQRQVWPAADFELLALGERLAEQRKTEWLIAKNGADPMRPGWPMDGDFSLKVCPISLASVIRSSLDRKWSGFPEFFSVREVRRLEKPRTPDNALLDASAERNAERDLLHKLLARGEQRDELLVRLLSERLDDKPAGKAAKGA